MKQTKAQTADLSKIITVNVLFFLSAGITLSGAFFIVYSLCLNLSFRVLNTDVSGAIFGLIVLYLGVRYFLMVRKLRVDVYGTTSKFNWNNLKPKNFFAKNK